MIDFYEVMTHIFMYNTFLFQKHIKRFGILESFNTSFLIRNTMVLHTNEYQYSYYQTPSLNLIFAIVKNKFHT